MLYTESRKDEKARIEIERRDQERMLLGEIYLDTEKAKKTSNDDVFNWLTLGFCFSVNNV